MSFPRKRESSLFNYFWTPVFTGVTGFYTFYEFIKCYGFVKNPIVNNEEPK